MSRMTRKEIIKKIEELIDPDIYEGFSADVFERCLIVSPDEDWWQLDDELLDGSPSTLTDLAFTSLRCFPYDFMTSFNIIVDPIGMMKKIINNATTILKKVEDGSCYLTENERGVGIARVKPMNKDQLMAILEHLQKHAKYDQERTALEEQKQKEAEAIRIIDEIVDLVGPKRASEILKEGFKK